jgi:hypothetical protein
MFPLDGGRSVMRTYETVVESATCERGKISDPGCILLRKAGADLATGKLEPSMFRQGWPGWRPLGANPETWAEDETEWTTLTIRSDEFTVETEYLYVKLTRGWLSEDFLGSSGWYINGECRGFVSDGDLGNDGTSDEFFPRMPVGLLFTRKLEIRRNNESFFKLTPTYLSGWVHKSIPLSPKQSDPCKKSCPDHDRIAPHCAGRPTD